MDQNSVKNRLLNVSLLVTKFIGIKVEHDRQASVVADSMKSFWNCKASILNAAEKECKAEATKVTRR